VGALSALGGIADMSGCDPKATSAVRACCSATWFKGPLGLQSQVVNAGTLEEYERAFARLKIDVNGVLLLADPSNDAYAGKIAELAQQYRLPTAFQLVRSRQQRPVPSSRLLCGFCGAKSLPICPYRCRPSFTSRSTSRPPRHLASQSPRRCSRSPTR